MDQYAFFAVVTRYDIACYVHDRLCAIITHATPSPRFKKIVIYPLRRSGPVSNTGRDEPASAEDPGATAINPVINTSDPVKSKKVFADINDDIS
jgi:hypothetical protein